MKRKHKYLILQGIIVLALIVLITLVALDLFSYNELKYLFYIWMVINAVAAFVMIRKLR